MEALDEKAGAMNSSKDIGNDQSETRNGNLSFILDEYDQIVEHNILVTKECERLEEYNNALVHEVEGLHAELQKMNAVQKQRSQEITGIRKRELVAATQNARVAELEYRALKFEKGCKDMEEQKRKDLAMIATLKKDLQRERQKQKSQK
jgi:hypothetical protein